MISNCGKRDGMIFCVQPKIGASMKFGSYTVLNEAEPLVTYDHYKIYSGEDKDGGSCCLKVIDKEVLKGIEDVESVNR